MIVPDEKIETIREKLDCVLESQRRLAQSQAEILERLREAEQVTQHQYVVKSLEVAEAAGQKFVTLLGWVLVVGASYVIIWAGARISESENALQLLWEALKK